MSKAVVSLIATATLFFIVLSPFNINIKNNNNNNNNNNHEEQHTKGGRLNRRFGYNKILERAPTFDPLLTKIEIGVEKKPQHYVDDNEDVNVVVVVPSTTSTHRRLDGTTSVSEVAETYQYLTSGGRLNTTLRLIILFPLLDREPKDGVVGLNELEAWITQRAVERLDYVTQAELDSKDKDGDFAISFTEYLPQFSQKDIEKREMGHGEAGWWMEKFEIADIDHNGLLNFTELRDFLHPEDSKNQELLKWMVRDRLKRMDDDEIDGKLNFNEFEDHIYNTYESYMDFETNGGGVPKAKDKFAELDVNKDQFLSPEELIPILPYVYPGELAYAKYFTCYLMNEADDDGDRKLTLQEMLSHEFTFYNTVHADGHVESDDDHDEL